MELKDIRATNRFRKSRRVGRGGKRGTYSGRGMKGQKSRAGAGIRPQIRDLIKRIPKLRGQGFGVKASSLMISVVSVERLDRLFREGEKVTPKTLLARGVIERKGSRIPQVKILGTGSLTKKLLVADCAYSKSAREKIEKAGGVIQ